jgi:tRNA A-37 threonylcarbamoyl transferase component Bud32
MNSISIEATHVTANPADSMLLSLARVLAGSGAKDHGGWPTLDLTDPRQREFGDYELLEELGRGGMGVVYKARQRSLDRDVAIKFIAEWFADASRVVRFLAEARVAARLIHPNIVPVHEVGSVEGMHYFSMPLIEGRSLATLLEQGTLPAPAATALLLKLCEAMDYAHRLGLLHLDLKPANVLIDARNEPLIADFGLARRMDERGGADAQEVSGTPQFMAPEQILIKQYRLTPATDIYALGAVLYQCLTGTSPHGEGEADEIIRRAAAGRVRPPREVNPAVPRDLDAICMKCLELQPRDRYATVAQLADDLRRARDGLTVSVRQVGFAERAQRWFTREPKFAAATAVALLTLASGAAATTSQWQAAATQRDVVVSERDRAMIASEIGAHLFAYQGDDRARDLIDWLRKRLPGDETHQADALATFITSLNAESADGTATLLGKIVEVLGAGYRQQMIRALETGHDANRQLYIALLSYNDAVEYHSGAFAEALKAALAEHPDDRLLWEIASVYCPADASAPVCSHPEAPKELTRLDPDNMYAWLVRSMNATDLQQSRAALHEAAQRTRFDDYLGATVTAYSNAVKAAAVPVPALIARPTAVLAPKQPVEAVIAREESARLRMAAWRPLIISCGASQNSPATPDPQIIADCLTIGETLMRSEKGLIGRMIGVAIVKTVAKGKPVAEEATQIRKLYTYLGDVSDKLSASQRATYSAEKWNADIAQVGEMAAMQRQAVFFGFPAQPPADWKPQDPIVLQSSRERYESMVALDKNGSALVAQGKYADALALLAPMEDLMRKRGNAGVLVRASNGWLLARFLLALGSAHLGLHDYVSAEKALTDACTIAAIFGPGAKEARDCARARVDLYTAWNAATPGKGYDTKADEWRQTLATYQAAKDD